MSISSRCKSPKNCAGGIGRRVIKRRKKFSIHESDAPVRIPVTSWSKMRGSTSKAMKFEMANLDVDND